MTFKEKLKIRKAFERRKEIIMLSIEDCTKDSYYETTLERLRVRLEELELWEDYIMKQ